MSFCTRPIVCKKCGKPLTLFEGWKCLECEKAEQEPKIDVGKLLDKTFDDFCKCEGGEGWLKIDGKEYSTDVGYALEGMRIFMEVFKRRLAESENKEQKE